MSSISSPLTKLVNHIRLPTHEGSSEVKVPIQSLQLVLSRDSTLAEHVIAFRNPPDCIRYAGIWYTLRWYFALCAQPSDSAVPITLNLIHVLVASTVSSTVPVDRR
jgi:hypothetical protein